MKRLLLVLSLVGILVFSQGVCQKLFAELITVHFEGTVDKISGDSPFTLGEIISGYFTYDPTRPSLPTNCGPKYEALSLGFSIGSFTWQLSSCRSGGIAIFHSDNNPNNTLDQFLFSVFNFDGINRLEGPFIADTKYIFNFTLNDPTHYIFSDQIGPNHTNCSKLTFPTDPTVLEGQKIYWGFVFFGNKINTGEGSAQIISSRPATPCALTKQILNIITCINLPKHVENSYVANLKKVCPFVETGKKNPAINQLDAFIKKVQQDIRQEEIGQADGYDLINMANDLIAKIQG